MNRARLSGWVLPALLLLPALVLPLDAGMADPVVLGPAAAKPPAAVKVGASATSGATSPATAASPRVAAPTAKPYRHVRRTRRSAGADQPALRANAEARDGPSAGAYVNSALFYDFEPGRIYTIQTSPRFLTTIQLRPGEKLISKAAGDVVRWVLGETQAGSGDTAQVTVLVKPTRPALRTNIVMTTDQRTYLIDATSNATTNYTSVVAWNYPQEEAAATAQAALARQAAAPVARLDIERLNFNYSIDVRKGRAPAWRPLRVFDDGAKTFIEFPAALGQGEAPPLFVLGPKDQAELVNYRQSGPYYIVDRLVEAAELRLGGPKQTIVRIARQGVRR